MDNKTVAVVLIAVIGIVAVITMATVAGIKAGVLKREAINACIDQGKSPIECRCALGGYCN